MRGNAGDTALVQQALHGAELFFGFGQAFFQRVYVALLLKQRRIKFVKIFFLKVLPLFQTGETFVVSHGVFLCGGGLGFGRRTFLCLVHVYHGAWAHQRYGALKCARLELPLGAGVGRGPRRA